MPSSEKHKKRGKPPSNVVPFPKKRIKEPERSPAEELLSMLKKAGFFPSPELRGNLKIQPWQKGKGEYEFFDLMSEQPSFYTSLKNPSFCYDKGKNAPDWVKKWYLAVVEEKKTKYIVLVYTPKRVFIKCRLDKAEEIIPAVMQEHTTNPDIYTKHGPVPPSKLP
jgi:hypothetical protein